MAEADDGPEAGGPRVVVALDVPDAGSARAMTGRLPEGTWCKVGLELFTAEGPGLVDELATAGHPVFLDLKLHDIPHTVAGATRSACRRGVRLLTVHAAGGGEMMKSAAESAAEAGGDPGPEILAVTVLTSLDDRLLAEVMGEGADVEASVGRLAVLAQEAGVHGAVASVQECRAIKTLCGSSFRVATPGIRLPGGASHDQKRVATPEEAADAGADYLVVGRAVTGADDPAAALEEVRRRAGAGS